MTAAAFDLPGEQWARLRALIDDALALPASGRDAWLEQAAHSHPALEPHLRALLAATSEPGLGTLPKLEGPHAPARTLTPGTLVGPYRLLRPLGQGGMASVWLAERVDMLQARQVALKLPHPALQRHGLAERLAREREILAALNHPHIASLYDAGVDDTGQPYLALEHVQGLPIDAYAREHGLGVHARLQLFLQVAGAVAHAHARLVVHRDLKPSNILVTAEGQVRLLDFGIAKLLAQGLAEETALTRELGRALTLDYAAPEQIRGEPVSTRADVYALGVLLCELLSGQRPYRLPRASRAALEEAILQAEPMPPSQRCDDARTRRALRGELDTIVLKALKKAPEARYATVDALADDVRRHLASEPVLARPDSRAYRLRRLLARHRLAAGAGLAMGMALLAGAGVALWQAREAGIQRDAALLALARADEAASAAHLAERKAVAEADLSSFLLSELAGSQASDTMPEQLQQALLMVRAQYRGDPGLRGHMLLGIGEQLRWISEHAKADAVFAEAEPLLREHGDPADLAQLLCIRAAAQARAGQPDAARTLLAEAARVNPLRTDAQLWSRAQCLSEEGLIARYAGDAPRAVTLTQEALALARRVGRGEQEDYADGLNALARAHLEIGQFQAAAEAARSSIALLERIGRDRSTGYRNAWGSLAEALRDGGHPLEAERAHGANGRFDLMHDKLPLPLRRQYANTLLQLQRHDRALPLLAELLAQALADGNLPEARTTLLSMAQAQREQGHLEEARARLDQAAPMFATAREKRQPQARIYLLSRAEWELAAGHDAEALAALDEARALMSRPPQAPRPTWRAVHRIDARLALARGDAAAALVFADRALALSTAHALQPATSLHVAQDLMLRALAQRALGHDGAAREDAANAARQAAEAAGADHPLVRQARALAEAPAT